MDTIWRVLKNILLENPIQYSHIQTKLR